MLDAITKVVDATVDEVETIDPQTVNAIIEVHNAEMVDYDMVDAHSEDARHGRQS